MYSLRVLVVAIKLNLRYRKTGNNTVLLVLKDCCKTSSKVMLHVLPPTSEHVLQQIRFLQVVRVVAESRE